MVEGIPLAGGDGEIERECHDQDQPGQPVRVSDLAVLEAEATGFEVRPDLNTCFGQVSGWARVFGKFTRAWHYAGAVPGASARSLAAQPPAEAARWPGRGRAAGSRRPS